jgi:quinol monooxygenase YgiN
MELIIFARFHAHEGKDQAVASEPRDAVTRVRTEPGCLGIEVYRSVRNSRRFGYILTGSMKRHSKSTWSDPKPINLLSASSA